MKTKTLLFPLLGASLLMAGTPGEAADPGYKPVLIDEGVPGAAFVVEANVRSGDKPELIVSGFGPVSVGPSGPVISDSGTVTVYRRAYRGYADKKERSKAIKHVVVGENELITFPNRAQPALINDDKREDIIVPGGYFFDTSIGQARGSLTWWENQQDGTQWVRHDIVTGSPFSYHSAVFEDFDGDGIADIASVAEDAGVASNPFDDVLELQLFAGVGDGTFAPAATVGLGGGVLSKPMMSMATATWTSCHRNFSVTWRCSLLLPWKPVTPIPHPLCGSKTWAEALSVSMRSGWIRAPAL